jgi:hypothetical protein
MIAILILALAGALWGVPIGLVAGWGWGAVMTLIGAMCGALCGVLCHIASWADEEENHHVRR